MQRSTLVLPAVLTLVVALTGCTASAAPTTTEIVSAAKAEPHNLPLRVPVVDPVVWDKQAVGSGDLGPVPLEIPLHSRNPSTGWIERGKTFAVVTWGSSVCPDKPTFIEVLTPREIVIEFDKTGGGCTFDLAPTVQGLTLPPEVAGRPVEVSFRFSDSSELFPQAALE